MQINLHQTHHEIGDFESIFKYITTSFQNVDAQGLHIFPELFLTGYPLQDLTLQKTFIEEYQNFLLDLNIWSERQFKTKSPCMLLLGGLKYTLDQSGLPNQIENVIYKLAPGKPLEDIYTKQLLPNYDIYEEKKYFTPGHVNTVLEFEGKKLALLICEDMWFSHLHDIDPVITLSSEYVEKNIPLDAIINLSASPYHLNKHSERIVRAREISQFLKAPFIYVNRVGAEDEILFDGQSFVFDGVSVIQTAQIFSKSILSLTLPIYKNSENPIGRYLKSHISSWQSIYSTRLSSNTLNLSPLSDSECEELINGLVLGMSDYALKNSLHKFTIALSGGMDSSLVVALLHIMKSRKDISEQFKKPIEIEAVFLPSMFSSSLSYDLAFDLCQNLKIKLTSFPIKFIHSSIKNGYEDCFKRPLQGLADENIQSRLRGALIYLRSNEYGSIVFNTSNKSEIAVGYSTQYGDSVGALSILGDLYKSEVFDLARYINKAYNNIIPAEVISRPPSAELRDNQQDSESLPPYDRLDPILEAFLSGRFTCADLISKGHKESEVLKVFQLISKSEYKRKQFCPIIKLKPKSFGFGYRMPINKKNGSPF